MTEFPSTRLLYVPTKMTRPTLLLNIRSLKTDKFAMLKFWGYLNRIATDLTIFNIRLFANGWIHQHRNFFPAIGALKEVFVHFSSSKFKTALRLIESRKKLTKKLTLPFAKHR